MKKIVKKNQVIITALALLIAVAGYVSYTKAETRNQTVETASDQVTDTYEISDEDPIADIFTDTEEDTIAKTDPADAAGEEGTGASADAGTSDGGDAAADQDMTGSSDAGETLLTSADASSVDFAAQVKLNREQVRGKNKESLMGIIDSQSVTDDQKKEAVDAMIALTDVAERESAAEMLLQAKGFSDVVVSVTDDTADVVLDMGDVTDAKRAQVEDIVKRKTGIDAQNIVITPLSAENDAQTE